MWKGMAVSGLLGLCCLSQVPRTGGGPAPPRQFVFMKPGKSGDPPPGPASVYEIAVMNLDGTGLRQLTHDGKFKFLPHFSPDGTSIVYAKFAVGAYGSPDGVMDIAVYDLAAGTETMVTHDGRDTLATWSPDGERIAYLSTGPLTEIWTIGRDGSRPTKVAGASGAAGDLNWGDLAWSRDNWILFTVAQSVNECYKVRTDKIRPDGSSRTQVSDGGPNCTPPGFEQNGDADPGWSSDGETIYSSRGFPVRPQGGPPGSTERKLYAFSSEAWFPGKPERDLSLASEASCIEGVPKGSPDGGRVLLFRMCFDRGNGTGGIYLTDNNGSYRRFLTEGFGPDWAPVRPREER